MIMLINDMDEIGKILDTFNLDQVQDLISSQINENYSNDATGYALLTNYLEPFYHSYRSIQDNDRIDPDLKEEAEHRYFDVCNAFLLAVCKKFHLELDPEWTEDAYKQSHVIATAFYEFFAWNIRANLEYVIVNYISMNAPILYEVFEEMKEKKDASTLYNKKTLSPELSVLISNIYDVSQYVLQQLNEEDFLFFSSPDEGAKELIRSMYQEGAVVGPFMETIRKMFRECLELRSGVCFNIIYGYREGLYRDPMAKLEGDEVEED